MMSFGCRLFTSFDQDGLEAELRVALSGQEKKARFGLTAWEIIKIQVLMY